MSREVSNRESLVSDDVMSVQGAGMDAFMSLSADTMKVWASAVDAIVQSTDSEEVDKHSYLTPVSGVLVDSPSEDEGLSTSSENSSDFPPFIEQMFHLLPAPLRFALGLISFVRRRGVQVLWGLMLGGGLVLSRSTRRGRFIIDGRSVDLDTNFLVIPGSVLSDGSRLFSSRSGNRLRATDKELRGAGVLYSKLTGSGSLVRRGALTSGFYRSSGAYHGAWDLGVRKGTRLYWPFSQEGVVVRVSEHRSGGRQLFVRTATHEWGFAHLDRNDVVPVGTVLSEGDLFAVSGNSGYQDDGRRMPAHLHVNATRLVDVGKGRMSRVRVEDAMLSEGLSFEDSGDLELGNYTDLSGSISSEGFTTMGSVSGDVRFGSALSERTNNPFSVMRKGGSAWEGEVGLEGLSGGRRMVRFSSPVYSARATAYTLLKYQMERDISGTGGRGVRLRDISRMFVYGHLGDVPTYRGDDADRWADTVSMVSGLSKDVELDLRNEDTLVSLLQGVARAESGTDFGKVSAQKAVRMAYQAEYRSRWNEQGVCSACSNHQR